MFFYDQETAKTRMPMGFASLSTNLLALIAGTPHGLFPTAKSYAENAAVVVVSFKFVNSR